MSAPDVEKAVITRLAAIRLKNLYQAYIASTQAYLMALRHMRKSQAQNNDMDEMRDLLIEQYLLRDEALTRGAAEVFRVRIKQLDRRIAELNELGV